jgi:hypothetical protein
MIVLAILATLVAIVLTMLVIYANGMSDSPDMPFQGGWIVGIAWVITAALWLAWWIG